MNYHQWIERKLAPSVRPRDVVEFVEHDALAARIRESLRDRQAAR